MFMRSLSHVYGYLHAMTDIPLVAVMLPNLGIADIAVKIWSDGEAIAPISITAPDAEVQEKIAQLRPTHIVDQHGRHSFAGGVGVPVDTAAVIATSGTTGAPKLVELTRSGMTEMALGYTSAIQADAGDTWLACMPLFHVASLAIIARAFVCELPFVVHDNFDLDRVGNSAEAEGVTMISLVPTALSRLLDAGARLDEFRCLIIGGAALAPALRTRAEAAGARLFDAYGLSETWGGCITNGIANNGVEMRLGDLNEIELRGAPVMRGYRFDDEATAQTKSSDGWFSTGDVGELNDGRLRVVDRLKDIVITGGVNVSPTEIENVLQRHPSIRDVCVIGVPDNEWGERVVAVVVPVSDSDALSLDALRDFAADRLSAAKLPKELRIIAEIPRSASGKALRRVLSNP